MGPYALVTWGRDFACVSTENYPKWIPAENVRPFRESLNTSSELLTTLALHLQFHPLHPWLCLLRLSSPPPPRYCGHPNQLLLDPRGLIDLSPLCELCGQFLPEIVEALNVEQASI